MFPYIGGKAHHVKWLDWCFPGDFHKFVEVFGGAGWVTVKSQKIRQAQHLVYNDRNELLANVYECFRSDPGRLLHYLERDPPSDQDRYKTYQAELFGLNPQRPQSLGDFDLAQKYLYLQTQIFSGTPLSATNVSYFVDEKTQGRYPSKYETLKRKLQNANILDRLKAITLVESLDCISLIHKHDSPETFFYLDPPYYEKEFYYSERFPRSKHQELAQVLGNIQGKFALSYYEFPELADWYPQDRFTWYRRDVYRAASTRSSLNSISGSNNRGEELLIMNYPKA